MRKKGKGSTPKGLTPAQYKAVMELQATIKNPLAKAQAKAKFFSGLTNVKLGLYLLEEGEKGSPVMGKAAHLLALIGMAAERHYSTTPVPSDVDVEFRILRGALSTATQGVVSWKTEYALPIERGIDAAVFVCRHLDAKHLLEAEHDINMMDISRVARG